MSNQNIIDTNISNFVLSSANNVFTGTNDFQKIITTYASIQGPAVIDGYELSPAVQGGTHALGSFTLSASELADRLIQLNGTLSTQTVFMPTAANFDAQLLSVFPGGSFISSFASMPILIQNKSTTATVTLTANTNFLVDVVATIPPQTTRPYFIVKTANTPEYTLYG